MVMKETLEEAACLNLEYDFQTWLTIHSKDKSTQIYTKVVNWCKGAKWQQERSYSEKDLKESFKGGSKMCWTDINQETQEPYYYDFKEWFEQFKKK